MPQQFIWHPSLHLNMAINHTSTLLTLLRYSTHVLQHPKQSLWILYPIITYAANVEGTVFYYQLGTLSDMSILADKQSIATPHSSSWLSLVSVVLLEFWPPLWTNQFHVVIKWWLVLDTHEVHNVPSTMIPSSIPWGTMLPHVNNGEMLCAIIICSGMFSLNLVIRTRKCRKLKYPRTG